MSIKTLLTLQLAGGLVLFSLLTFQLLSGLRMIQVSFKLHKIVGVTFFIIGIFHALFGIYILIGT